MTNKPTKQLGKPSHTRVAKVDKKHVELQLASLKPHPRNAKLYKKRSPEEVEDLAQDMATNGQTEAVEVTADSFIISGHGRCEAAKLLGWETVRCRVRHDLSTPEAVERRLIEANLYRRQLSRLDLVRSYRELKKLSRDQRGRSPSEEKVKGDLRDLIAKRFTPPVSGRTLDRWLQVLEMPIEIQEAVDTGRMKLTDALKLAALDARELDRVAAKLHEGKPVEEVIAQEVEKTSEADLLAGRALDRLLKALGRAQEDLAPSICQLRRVGFSGELEGLREGQKLIEAVIGRITANQRKHATTNK